MQANTIRPSADLRNHYSEISRQCHDTRKPVFITVNGRGDTVVLSYAEYNQMQSELDLLRTLSDAEEDARAGRTAPIQQTFDDIRAKLSERKHP